MTMPLESSMVISGLTEPLLTGSISEPIVTEVGGVAPSSVIRTDQDWEVNVNWSLEGSLLAQSFFTFKGDWIVRLFLESMGPKDEYELPEGGDGQTVSVDRYKDAPHILNKRDYSTKIEIKKNTVVPGIYKMVMAITYEVSKDKPGPIAGFYEGGMLQIYQAS